MTLDVYVGHKATNQSFSCNLNLPIFPFGAWYFTNACSIFYIYFVLRDGRVMGVLEVSRSIGDGQYKKLGVTCVPEVRKCQIQDTDRY